MKPLITYCFDLDSTLCFTNGTDYENSKPIVNRVMKVNQLYIEGHFIKIYTARGSETKIDHSALTKHQLLTWGLKFHELHFGKPFANFYIDDKAIKDSDFDWE